ncbi:carbohydrate kinase family protein [Streptomyces sp. ME02-8801-2C]|uniref:carbohydrate kinase family protein n=1 Tax=Streptomyces sp. ME02-8801-2C TaxID=3028680 RepID=UPI0029BF2381|nr:carbohydrate kinase family protein [Streptomyces sp. ME02-8801-2C]MDX3457576.1 carbohydrate kinase family protein [Streptomyces sp. ME02-8801-2C]
MRIAVTGSIAIDQLMGFSGSFAQQLIGERLDQVSLSFLAESLEIRRGGVAANIAFGLGRLGVQPVLVAAAGVDFDDYRVWLKEHRVDTDWVRVSDRAHTARFICTTDRENNQIGTFYPGAMSEAREISIADIARRTAVDHVLVSPDDPGAMVRHARECRTHGITFSADPSQQLAVLERAEAQDVVRGARFLFTNAYEAELLTERTGWSKADVLEQVGTWVITQGADGVHIESARSAPLRIPAVPVRRVAEPTGAGDAFRAGFLAGQSWRLGTEQSAWLGCAMASAALATTGTQTYELSRRALKVALRAGYGSVATDAVTPHLGEVL